MKFNKPPISLDAKLALLQERWLVITNIDFAKKHLQHIWYFRLTWYCKYYQDTNTNIFKEWVTFDTILDLYMFDRELRLLVLDAIEKIEVSIKTHISDHMSLKYWVFRYAEKSLFAIASETHEKIYEKLQEIIKSKYNKSWAMFVNAYKEKYTSEIMLPSWMLLEEFTMWELSTLYNLLLEEDSKIISAAFWVYYWDFRRWLLLLVNIRNIAAHHARLWNRRYTSKPRVKDIILKDKLSTEISENATQEVIANFFNASLVIDYLLSRISDIKRWDALQVLFTKYPNINLLSMWFEDNRRNKFL